MDQTAARDGPDGCVAVKELVRLGETTLAGQLRMFELHHAQARHLLTLTGGVLVVAVAIASVVGERSMGAFLGVLHLGIHGFLGLLTTTFFASFTAAVCFSLAYAGSRNRPMVIYMGWEPSALFKAAIEKDGFEDIQVSTLLGMKRWYRNNDRMLKTTSKLIRRGTWALSFGGTTLALGLIYSLGAI